MVYSEQGIKSNTTRVAPIMLSLEPKIEEVWTKFIDLLGMMCNDQIEICHVCFNSGNKYLMVLYNYDTNAILT